MNGDLCIDGIRPDFKQNAVGQKIPCRLWTGIKGKSPQSNEEFETSDCAWAWGPIMSVENSQTNRFIAASIDKFFNGFVKILPPPQQRKAMGLPPDPKKEIEIGPTGDE